MWKSIWLGILTKFAGDAEPPKEMEASLSMSLEELSSKQKNGPRETGTKKTVKV